MMSWKSATDIGATQKPRFSVAWTMPSCARRLSASRMGELLRPYAFDRLSTFRREPGGNSQRIIAVRILVSAMSFSEPLPET
ncbi:hypothetical protein D3C72_2189940 [compost metagenome]